MSWRAVMRLSVTPALVLLMTLLLPAPSKAQWIEGGVPVARGNNQIFAQTTDGSGGALVVWTPYVGAYDWNLGVYHLLRSGSLDPSWPSTGVPLCSANGAQLFPNTIPDGSNGAFAVWLDARGRDITTPPFADPYAIYAHRVTSEGAAAPGWPVDGLPVCTGFCTSTNPVLATDGQGGMFIGWSSSGATGDLRLQHVTGGGEIATGWPSDGLLVCAASNEKQVRKAVSDGTGGVYLSWD